MKYLSFVRSSEKYREMSPPAALMEAMGKFIEKTTREGGLVDTGGLAPSEQGFRIRLQDGQLTTTDGPFSETKEVIGGYAMIEAASIEEAREITRRFLAVHGDEWNVECEVRALAGPEFGARGLDPAMMKACGEQPQTA